VSTVNYQVGITAIATGALVPVDAANSNRFSAKSPAAVDFIADVVGYFRAPGGTIGDITAVSTGAGLSGGGTSGAVSLGIATAGVTAAMMASNGCTSGQILKYNGTNWACAADATGGGGGVTAVTASAPLASSGGTAPNITLTGAVAVANGGTGLTSLPTNGVLYGQGTGAVAATVGHPGEVLVGTATAPVWTGSPALLGNLGLSWSFGPGAGTITKGGANYIHNFGVDSTYMGVAAGNFAASGNGNNTGIGASSLANLQNGAYNTGVGSFALALNTTGSNNTAGGTYALRSNTAGSRNAAHGYATLYANTLGNDNTAIGYGALWNNTTAHNNTAVGSGALYTQSFTDANPAYVTNNTAVGFQALYSNQPGPLNSVNGKNNTGVGMEALYSNTGGTGNTALGQQALSWNQTGNLNTALGRGAGRTITGSNNIAIGADAGSGLETGNSNIHIGHTGYFYESNVMRLGDSAYQAKTYIAGIRGVTTSAANAIPVLIDANGQLGTASSSRRFKFDIADMDDTSSALMKLRPVTFRYRDDPSPGGPALQYGLIAEEVAEVLPELVARSADGRVETVMYQFLTPMLLNELHKQQRASAAQQAAIVAQGKELERLRAELAALRSTQEDVAALRAAMTELLRERAGGLARALTGGIDQR
jgi:hypothetical protein